MIFKQESAGTCEKMGIFMIQLNEVRAVLCCDTKRIAHDTEAVGIVMGD